MPDDDQGESTAAWAMRQQGFFCTIKQLCCCGRCGSNLPHGTKRKVFGIFKPGMHFLCDECFAALPD
jgi:hypothetical protein